MYENLKIALIIPALDEEGAIAALLEEVDRALVDELVVVDNGSTDRTGEVARAAGARVVVEARRGYGSACLAGIAAMPSADVLVFMDGDGSDDPRDIARLLQPITDHGAELVIGSRTLGQRERGSLTPLQVYGNLLTCGLVRLLWGQRYTDLGPLRAIRRPALERLAMRDPDFGWTIEMQVKAAQQRLAIVEVAVSHRQRRAGRSKVSGTLVGSYRAGRRILGYVVAAKLGELRGKTHRC